jgi:hypothetical protein
MPSTPRCSRAPRPTRRRRPPTARSTAAVGHRARGEGSSPTGGRSLPLVSSWKPRRPTVGTPYSGTSDGHGPEPAGPDRAADRTGRMCSRGQTLPAKALAARRYRWCSRGRAPDLAGLLQSIVSLWSTRTGRSCCVRLWSRGRPPDLAGLLQSIVSRWSTRKPRTVIFRATERPLEHDRHAVLVCPPQEDHAPARATQESRLRSLHA